jgi:hypothetical protein
MCRENLWPGCATCNIGLHCSSNPCSKVHSWNASSSKFEATALYSEFGVVTLDSRDDPQRWLFLCTWHWLSGGQFCIRLTPWRHEGHPGRLRTKEMNFKAAGCYGHCRIARLGQLRSPLGAISQNTGSKDILINVLPTHLQLSLG